MTSIPTMRRIAVVLAATSIWFSLYAGAAPVADLIVRELLGFSTQQPIGAALHFFLYDTAKILLLLVAMIYLIGWLRAGLDAERVRDVLAGKSRWASYGLASLFGAITPFCSCSSIPLFLGFTMARIPIGITLSFLVTSPLVNEVAVVMLWNLLGVQLTILYVAIGLTAGIMVGAFMDALGVEQLLQPQVRAAIDASATVDANVGGAATRLTFDQRHDYALAEVRTLVGRLWKWVLVGVGAGALIHGFVPEQWVIEHLSDGAWWNVPTAVFLGLPLYANVTGIVPVMETLLTKGVPLGTTLALCMSTVAASLPELLMLKQVMSLRLLALFLCVLLVLFTLIGWCFNALPTSFVS